jgi:hypothetical protein
MKLRDAIDRYEAAFGVMPPLLFWLGTDEALAVIFDRAIRDGKKVTQGDLMRAQDGEPAPDDAIY